MNTRNIRFFHRRINFNGQSKQRNKCIRSLAHSLRLAPTPTKDDEDTCTKLNGLQWDESLATNNRIWVNGTNSYLCDWSEESRQELLENMVPKPRLHSQTKLQNRLRNYRLKIKKAIVSEQSKGNHQAARFLQDIVDAEIPLSIKSVERFSQLKMTRKQQRIKMLESYMKLHCQLYGRPHSNYTCIQEGIFKVPHQWEVGTDLISLEEYIEFTVDFLTDHFPRYPIQLIVGHDDERSPLQNTGAHVHYYLSGKNSETGDYDLRKAQLKVVNQYLIKQDITQIPEDRCLSSEETRDLGRYFQQMVFEYANRKLFNPKGLNAEFAPATEQRSELRKQMNLDAKLPKEERRYQHATHMAELTAKDKALKQQLSQENEKLQTLNRQLETDNQKQNDENIALAIKSSEMAMENDELKQEITAKKARLTQLELKCAQMSELIRQLTDKTVNILQSAFKHLLFSFHAKNKDMRAKSIEFLQSAFKEKQNLPDELSKAIDAVADEIDKPTNESNKGQGLER